MNGSRVLAATQHAPVNGAAAILAVLVGIGCTEPDPNPDEDGVVETTHLRLTTTTDHPICAGTPLFLESELERISSALELPLWPEDDKVEVRFGQDAVAEVCDAIELESVNGCVHYDDTDVIVAALEVSNTTPHELVHAIRRRNIPPVPPIFEEGLAQILSASDGFPLYVDYPQGDPGIGPLELLEIPSAEFGGGYYIAAQSFVAWLWETEGRSALMAYVNDPAFTGADAATPLFEQHFGLPLADAEQAWRDDDRPDPIWGTPCIPERTYSLADGPLELSGTLDCSEPDVYGAAYSMSLWPMCLEVPQTTRVRISFEADHGRLQILLREPCDYGPSSAEADRDKYIDAGTVIEQDIVGCRFRMLLGSREPGFEATEYAVRIEEI